MKKRKHHFKVEQNRRKAEEKNKVEKNKDVSIYSYTSGQKNINLAMETVGVLKTPETVSPVNYHVRFFCGKALDAQTQTCPDSNHPLVKVNFKNSPLRQTCRVCSAPFSQLESAPAEKEIFVAVAVDPDYHNHGGPGGMFS